MEKYAFGINLRIYLQVICFRYCERSICTLLDFLSPTLNRLSYVNWLISSTLYFYVSFNYTEFGIRYVIES